MIIPGIIPALRKLSEFMDGVNVISVSMFVTFTVTRRVR